MTWTATGSDRKCRTLSVICATMTAKQTVSRKIQIIRRPFSRFSSVAALRPEILTCDRISFSFSDLWRFSRLMVTENDPWLLPLGWFGTWKEEFVNGVKSDLFLWFSFPIKLVWSSQFLRLLSTFYNWMFWQNVAGSRWPRLPFSVGQNWRFLYTYLYYFLIGQN